MELGHHRAMRASPRLPSASQPPLSHNPLAHFPRLTRMGARDRAKDTWGTSSSRVVAVVGRMLGQHLATLEALALAGKGGQTFSTIRLRRWVFTLADRWHRREESTWKRM